MYTRLRHGDALLLFNQNVLKCRRLANDLRIVVGRSKRDQFVEEENFSPTIEIISNPRKMPRLKDIASP